MRVRAVTLTIAIAGAFAGCIVPPTEHPSTRAEQVHRLGIVAQTALVATRQRANEAVVMEAASPSTKLTTRITLKDAAPVEGRVEDGIIVYANAIAGGDLVHVPLRDGFE